MKRSFTPESLESRASRAIELAVAHGSGSSGPMSPSTPSRTSYRLTGSFEPGGAGQTRSMLFDIAEEFGLPVDVHVDFDADPEQKVLEVLADITLERGFQRRVLAIRSASRRPQTFNTSGPLVVFRVHRGSSRTKELLDAGVNVAAGSDNVNDMWFAFGRLDPVETAYVAILSAAPSLPWVPPPTSLWSRRGQSPTYSEDCRHAASLSRMGRWSAG